MNARKLCLNVCKVRVKHCSTGTMMCITCNRIPLKQDDSCVKICDIFQMHWRNLIFIPSLTCLKKSSSSPLQQKMQAQDICPNGSKNCRKRFHSNQKKPRWCFATKGCCFLYYTASRMIFRI